MSDSLRNMILGDFLRFLESNKLINCDVKLGESLDADDIDPRLIDELVH